MKSTYCLTRELSLDAIDPQQEELEDILEHVRRELPRRLNSMCKAECEITDFVYECGEIQAYLTVDFTAGFNDLTMQFWSHGRSGEEIVEDALDTIRTAGKAVE